MYAESVYKAVPANNCSPSSPLHKRCSMVWFGPLLILSKSAIQLLTSGSLGCFASCAGKWGTGRMKTVTRAAQRAGASKAVFFVQNALLPTRVRAQRRRKSSGTEDRLTRLETPLSSIPDPATPPRAGSLYPLYPLFLPCWWCKKMLQEDATGKGTVIGSFHECTF